jgi:hypothetical protein
MKKEPEIAQRLSTENIKNIRSEMMFMVKKRDA